MDTWPWCSLPERCIANPSLVNLSNGRLNKDAWSKEIHCAKITEVEQLQEDSKEVKYFEIERDGRTHYFRLEVVQRSLDTASAVYVAPSDSLLRGQEKAQIRAFSEYRQRFYDFQPSAWILYHAFVILELDAGDSCFMCSEKYNNQLELMVGQGPNIHLFMKHRRATGDARELQRCYPEPRVE